MDVFAHVKNMGICATFVGESATFVENPVNSLRFGFFYCFVFEKVIALLP